MTPALRLVVAWMVCALAVAVWHRARWWQGAEPEGCASAESAADSVLQARAEIWHDRLHWRDVDVRADWNGRVDRIVISNPLGRGVDIVVSVF